MAEIVNLRLIRKRKRRTDKESDAAENRVRHGRSPGEKAATSSQRVLSTRRLDGHRRENAEGEDDG